MKGKETYRNINQAISDQRVTGSSDPLPSAGPVERPHKGRQAKGSRDEYRSVHDCACSSMTDHSPLHDTGTDMALSVTRHAQISQRTEWELLTCGIDTLDMSLYVKWDENWEHLKDVFDGRKELAQGCNGIPIDKTDIRPHIFMPTAKAPNFRYKLKFPEYIIDIGIAQTYKGTSPNVYISITSEALWLVGIDDVISIIRKDIESFGGHIEQIKPSRCDLCADFRIPGGLSFEFLREHMVSRCTKLRPFLEGDTLETLYVGGKKADAQIRIYDKGKEIENNRKEPFSNARWMHVWQTNDLTDVWRFEFQLRRPLLKQFRIDTIEDLKTKAASVWRYLTKEWFSLRNPDNENQSRRTFYREWRNVQSCGVLLGSYQDGVTRKYNSQNKGFLDWYIQRIARYILTCAVILENEDLPKVLKTISYSILTYWSRKDFSEEYIKESIKLGIQTNIPPESEGMRKIQEALKRNS